MEIATELKHHCILGEQACSFFRVLLTSMEGQACHLLLVGAFACIPASLAHNADNIKLWYPVGYGSQNLYNLRVDILHQDVVLDSYEQRTGFRQVELIQAHDSHGQSFYFRCNNIDIFCGGACWIPADSLLPRVSSKKYRRSLELMIEGNQNMIRYVSMLNLGSFAETKV